VAQERPLREGDEVAYVLSFAVIARFWIAHHRVFPYILGYDDTLI
jgi:uncharacterized membrane protein